MIKAKVHSQDILNPIYIEDLQTYPHNSNTVTFQHPSHDITFSHEFIISEIDNFYNFTNQGSFTKAHLAALVNAVYCPQGHLNAVYSNVARKTQRFVLSNSPDKLIWLSKLQSHLFPTI